MSLTPTELEALKEIVDALETAYLVIGYDKEGADKDQKIVKALITAEKVFGIKV